jgi:cardiolipin synthase
MSSVALLLIAEIAWVGGLSIWIIMERRSPQATLAWILVLAWTPYVGVVIYLLVGPRRLTRKRRRYARARSTVAQASADLRSQTGEGSAPSVLDPAWVPFTELSDRLQDSPPVRAERLDLFVTGDDCFASIEEAIGQARHHVHLEYYIWCPDRTGTRLRDLLCEKARQGVQVRLLLDSIGSAGVGRRFLRPLVEAGGEVGWFNRISFSRLRPGLMNFRTHRKIVVCDGCVGFTGGVNICDHESAAMQGKLAWRDTHLRVDGLPVHWLQRVFLEDWYFAKGTGPRHAAYFPCSENASATASPWVQIVASGPDSDSYAIHKLHFAAIATAQRRVFVTTPYFVPDEAILAALTTAALRGVDVRVLVPKRSDSRLVMAAGRSYYDRLMQAGVTLYEYGPSMLHAKTLVADDMAFVGTANMDNRSFRLNFEVIAAIYDAHTADTLATIFAHDQRHAEHYTQRRARRTPFHERLMQSTARLLSPLL